jgi:peptidyl-prolyl cis-trans isomerase SurA
MNKLRLFLILFLVLIPISSTIAQDSKSDSLVFSIDDEKVYKSEFVRQYEKSNSSSMDNKSLSVEEYLDMYINFKLKVKAAKDMGYDTLPKFLNEYNNYRKQLADKFISNGEVTEKMVRETYEHIKNEVNVDHILVSLKADASPNDTIVAYNKAIDIIKEIKEGKDFNELAKKYSDDPSVKDNNGNMGWFKAFKMVCPFEKAAYDLDINEVSLPVRTSFGYHIIKKNDERVSRGTITVAHIMKYNQSKERKASAKEEIFKLYQKIQNGESFDDLAKQFSEHKQTADRGGKLTPFSTGQLNSSIFEEVAFRLNEKDSISKPFETQFGWHIVKFIEDEPVKDFETLKNEIVKKIKTSDRSKKLIKNIKKDLMKRYEVNVNYETLSCVEQRVDSSLFSYKWRYEPILSDDEKWILKIDDNAFYVKELLIEINKSQRSLKGKSLQDRVNEAMDNFTYAKLISVHNKNLEFISPEFAQEIKTYYEGLLMFDVMQNHIWKPSQEDSLGQLAFYNQNKNEFKSKTKVSGIIANTKDKKIAKSLTKVIHKEKLSELKEKYPDVIFQEVELTEIDNPSIPKKLELKLNSPKTYKNNNQYMAITLSDIEKERILEFEEVKGRVIAKLQTQKEDNWLASLKNKYKIYINKPVLQALK